MLIVHLFFFRAKERIEKIQLYTWKMSAKKFSNWRLIAMIRCTENQLLKQTFNFFNTVILHAN